MSEWITMQPGPIRVQPEPGVGGVWVVERPDGVVVPWVPETFAAYGLTPPEPPPPPVTVTVTLTAEEADVHEEDWGNISVTTANRARTRAKAKLAAAIREQREATDG